MKINIPLYYCVSGKDINKIRAFRAPVLDGLKVGEELAGYVKIANSLSDIPDLPTVKKMLAQKHYEVSQKLIVQQELRAA